MEWNAYNEMDRMKRNEKINETEGIETKSFKRKEWIQKNTNRIRCNERGRTSKMPRINRTSWEQDA